MTQQRWIIHADMDAFYASVEQRDHPEYQGKPVIVGGKSNRGVVAAASYEARQYGVHSAMSVMEAKRRCPQGIYVVPQISKYAEISAQIVHIFADFSPRIETLALDEAFLDVTGMELLHGDVVHIARQIKSRVYAELGLIVSVGVAVNKFLAKLASAHRKPDGLVIIRPGEELEFLAPLPVSRLWGVGEVTEKKLRLLQVDSVGKLRKIDPYTLERTLGKAAIELYNLAWGRDERPVIPDREAKSIGNEDTFETDIEQPDEIRTKLLDLAERVGWRVRKEGLAGKTITLKVRFSSFRTITRSITLQDPVSLDEVIYEVALQLMDKIIVKEGIRLLGVSVSNFSQRSTQLCLFNEVTEKREKIASTMDELKERFGTEIVKRGRLL
ncbi:DNA polymerase IV [Propionispora hippei]|uniref:DNA polymerase IV n=1 Tax=Propionispora hippei DSM 15287 TaxID=1123003 RepID=A0A1M6LRU4_9FIRM|nr:DNA polymerase IV [Propionispora hippei]SHJ73871.1 DNA polymerase-4 [Propionispora hippei DSM 15287]